MIVDKNGIINIRNWGLKISPDFTLNELKSNLHFAKFIYGGSNDGYERYTIKDMLIDGIPFGAIFLFFKDKISQIALHYNQSTSFDNNDDHNWKKHNKDEDLVKIKHDEWLIEQHGETKTKYQWGSIGSYLDTRWVYSANIIIKYNNSPTKPRPSLDKNGTVYIETLGIKLHPDFTLEELKNKEPNERIKYAGSNGGYERYIINDIVDELPYSFLLLFNNRKIEFINIYYFIKITDKPLWEITSAKMYDEMMIEEYEGGQKLEYLWGTQCGMRSNKREEGPTMIYRYKTSQSN